MKIDITEQKDNAYLHRKEVSGTISFTGATPSNADIRGAVAKQTGAQEDCVVVRKIDNSFGFQNATFKADAYASKEALEKAEPKKKEVKKEE